VLADGRRESGAAASARLAVLESIDKDSRPPSVEPSPRESRAPMQACGRGESSRLLGRGC